MGEKSPHPSQKKKAILKKALLVWPWLSSRYGGGVVGWFCCQVVTGVVVVVVVVGVGALDII